MTYRSNIMILLCFWISVSSFGQDSIFGLNIEKPKYIYVFDGVRFEKMTIKEVSPVKVFASSTLTSKTDAYKPEHLLDHNDATAWVEGQSDNGVGASLIFEFQDVNDYPDVIEIYPGYGKDEKTWLSNIRPIELKVTLLDENKNVQETIEEFTILFTAGKDGKLIMSSHFVDISAQHLQVASLSEFKYVKFEITEVENDGAKYKDMCISTVNFYKGDKVISTLTTEEYQKVK